ncbi:MAG: class I SAM-dependent methyltransferase [Euryarchaeota archaeon]|nr:class I SAM-dependent methyltransferase [Euryarchaeota archaeon]
MAPPGDVETFDRFARFYDLFPVPTHPKAIRRAIDGRGGLVVDLGGGTGKYTNRVVPDRARAAVVDASREMLRRAARRRLPTIQAGADRVPIRDGTVDTVLCTEAFHHFAGIQDAVLDEVARILKPDGMFLLEEPDPTRLLGRLMRWGEHVQGWDSRFHPPDVLVKMLEERFGKVLKTKSGLFTVLLVAERPRL